MGRRRELQQQPATDFAFIQCSHPARTRDRDVQRAIRRHVMKDIGRARRKKPRYPVINLEFVERVHRHNLNLPDHADDPYITDTTLPATYGSIYPSPRPTPIIVPGVDLTTRALELVHFMKAEIDYTYRAFHVIWIRAGLSDSTCFYLSLASTTVYLNRMTGKHDTDIADNSESSRYYNEALRQLNVRLSDSDECKSPGVIATILGCLCHDTNVNDWNRWSVHIRGLKRLSDVRGGLEGLENYISLTAWWLDLVGCSVLDERPRFALTRDRVPASGSYEATQGHIEKYIDQILDRYPELSPIARALIMMDDVAETLDRNGNATHFWRDEVGGIGLIGPVIHHLLIMPRLPDNCSIKRTSELLIAQELVRLVFLMLLSDLKRCLSLNASDMLPLQTRFLMITTFKIENITDVVHDLTFWASSTFNLLRNGSGRDAENIRLQFMLSVRSLVKILCPMSCGGV